MPRVKRTVFDSAIYHILNRGHDRQKLLRDGGDFEVFKAIIARYKIKFQFDVYHYCFMPNHFHILLKIIKGSELSSIMKGICQSYAFYYKKKYDFVGYVFQNRYKSILIEEDGYLMECGRYIERNPVRAGLVDDPAKYHWSSYNFYAKSALDGIITPDPLYEEFASVNADRVIKYVEYVAKSRPYEQLLDEKLSELK